MAKPIKLKKGQEFHFAPTKAGGESLYPWDSWLNGDLIMLEQSVGDKDDKGTVVNVKDKRDFEVDTDAMPAKLKVAGRRRYKIVQVSRKDVDGKRLVGALIIKARDMTAEERAEEDKQRILDKQKAADRRAKKETEEDAGKAAAAPNAGQGPTLAATA